MRTKIIIALLTVYTYSIHAAVDKKPCSPLKEWTDQIRVLLPGVDLKLLNDKKQIEIIIQTLYTDEFFVPVFGKPFSQLSKSKRENIWRKITDCHESQYLIGPWGQLMNPLSDGTKYTRNLFKEGPFSYNGIIAITPKISDARSQWKELLGKLEIQNRTFSKGELDQLKKLKYNNEAFMFKPDIERANELIRIHESLIAFEEQKASLESLVQQPARPENIDALFQYAASIMNHSKLEENSRYELRNAAQERIESMIEEWNSIRSPEYANMWMSIESVDLLISEFEQINKWSKDYYKSIPGLTNLIRSLKAKQTELVVNLSSDILNMAHHYNSSQNLRSHINRYLGLTDKQNPEIKKLESALNQMAIEIDLKKEQEEQRKMQEAEEKSHAEYLKLMDETTPSGEPTCDQIEFSIRYQHGISSQEKIDAVDALSDFAPQLKAINELFGVRDKAAGSGIDKIECLGCVKAVSKPGFVCDYTLYNTGNKYGKINTGRFNKVDGTWKIVEVID